MKHRTGVAILIGLGIMGLSVLASQKNPVTRPHKAMGQFHVVINIGYPFGTGDLSFDTTGVGTGNHLGLFHSHLTGLVALGPNGPMPVSGGGIITAANGDQLFVKEEPDGVTTTITGGTGRFEGATGSMVATTVGTPVVVYDPVAGTLTVDSTLSLEGALAY